MKSALRTAVGVSACFLASAQNEQATLSTQGVQGTVDIFQSRHEDRDLRHTVPPVITPRGCTYEFDHGTTTFVDEIFCPDWCGAEQDFTFTTTTLCDEDGNCESFADCRVIGCTDDCGPGVGDCPCDTSLTSLEAVCDVVCVPDVPTTPPPTGAPIAPVAPPTDAPVAMPVATTPMPVATTPMPVATTPMPVPVPTTPAPVETPTPDCFSDTTLLLEFVIQADPSQVTTYTLCPNTVFDIGRLDGMDGDVVDGMAPLVARSNSHYICGDDGSVSNSCVFRGGQVQVFSSYAYFSESTTNCLIKGVTFESSDGAGASLGNVGEITFEDCIFKDHANVGTMLLTFDPDDLVSGSRTRRLALDDAGSRLERSVFRGTSVVVREFAEELARRDSPKALSPETKGNGRVNSGLASMSLGKEYAYPWSIQETVDNFQSRHTDRDLRHTVPPVLTPRGCNYDYQHGDTTFVDEIFCPDWCGDGQDFTFTTTTLCDEAGNCESFADCRVIGCTDSCGPGVGDCPCDTTITSPQEICEKVCLPAGAEPTAAPVSLPVPPPTSSPVFTPVVMPTTSPVSLPATPAPIATTAAPIATTAAPIATTPAPVAPTQPPVPATTPSPVISTPIRQKVNIVRTVFTGNMQGMPLDQTSRGIITTGTRFNDLVISLSTFRENDFGDTDIGYAVLAVEGSSVDIRDSSFTNNEFAGLGAVVVLNGGSATAVNITGTVDDDLDCAFMAVSSGNGEVFNCVEFDVVETSPTSAPETKAPTPQITPMPARTPTTMPIDMPVRPPTDQPARPPEPTPPIGKRPSPPPTGKRPSGTPSGRGKGGKGRGKMSKKSKKSSKGKKSKKSSYCDDDGKRGSSKRSKKSGSSKGSGKGKKGRCLQAALESE